MSGLIFQQLACGRCNSKSRSFFPWVGSAPMSWQKYLRADNRPTEVANSADRRTKRLLTPQLGLLYMDALTTPDGRYLIVRGRLWRTANPGLSAQERERLVHELMDARRAVKVAKAAGSSDDLSKARRAVRLGSASGGRFGGRTAPKTSIATWSATLPTQSGSTLRVLKRKID
jgi:hypothetical protein